MCSADPHWLNKATSPIDSITSRQIQINSQEVVLPALRTGLTSNAAEPLRVRRRVGLDVSINSSQLE